MTRTTRDKNLSMSDPSVLTFRGKSPGKTLAIFAGIHGNETGGILALRQLIDDLHSERLVLDNGTLHLVFANLAAIARDVRFTELNMNRAFHFHSADVPEEGRLSYERMRAIDLQPILVQSDALLDLHSTLTETSPFIICEEHSFEIAKLLPFPIVSTGWDAVHAGSTDAFMNQQGKIGVCVECGQHGDPEAEQRARTSIEVFLWELGLMDTGPKVEPVAQRRIHARSIYKAHTHMRFTPPDRDQFCVIQKGEVIGFDGDEEVRADQESILLFPKEGTTKGGEAFVLGEIRPL